MNAEQYAKQAYRMEILEDPDEGGYVISFPELPGCITVGETLQQALDNAQDAKLAWMQAALESGLTIPLPDTAENYSGQFKLRLPRSLHKSLTEQAKREGTSLNQYCVYLLSQNNALATTHKTVA